MESVSFVLGMLGLLICIGAFVYRTQFCRKYLNSPLLFWLYLVGMACIGIFSIVCAFLEFSNSFAVVFAMLQIGWCAVSAASIFTTPNKFEIPGFYIVSFTAFCGYCIGTADEGVEPARPYVHLALFGVAVLVASVLALLDSTKRRGGESKIIYEVKPEL